MHDTIAAVSTPTGGALAVVRVCGPDARRILTRIFSGSPEPRRVSYGRLTWQGELIDMVTAVFFQGPASFTGEDMVEITTHGGQAVVQRALNAVLAAGARPAEPGEFTRRAFLNGKLDLAQAEAVMDLINAQSQRSAQSAAEQLSGTIGRRIQSISERLVDALAGVNAAIDYPEELDEDVFSALPQQLQSARSALGELIQNGLRGKVLREGARVVLVGRPNVGKSSLYNALLGNDRAIVTEYAGTTRDVLMEQTQFHGLPIQLYDTAGFRFTQDPVERIGVERGQTALEQADFVLLVLDASRPLEEQDFDLIRQTRGKPRAAALNKTDLPAVVTPQQTQALGLLPMPVSAVTGQGLDELCRYISDQILPDAFPVCITNARHIQALEQACACLDSALLAMEPDCVATDLSQALEQLFSITGQTVTETVIDRIFQRFCVGK